MRKKNLQLRPYTILPLKDIFLLFNSGSPKVDLPKKWYGFLYCLKRSFMKVGLENKDDVMYTGD